MPVANARMYSATPRTKAAWKELLAWVLSRAGLDWEVIDYDAPAPLNDLWARADLGVAMMCGLPFALRQQTADARVPRLIAAPIPSPVRYLRSPIYFTDVVVRADAPYQGLEATFGGTAGCTLADSMSGGIAFNAHLEQYRTPGRRKLYRATVGNLVNARGVIGALAEGRIDVGPLDSYFHDLLRHDDPAFAAQVRTVTTTAALPIPPLVATAALTEDEIRHLQGAFVAVGEAEQLQPLREALLLAGFAIPHTSGYEAVAAVARRPMAPFEEL